MGIVLQEMELQLGRFGEHLLRRQLVTQEKAKYYVFWVRKYLLEVPEDSSQSLQERLAGFLERLRAQDRADWQVDQAERALRLYFNNFLNQTEWQTADTAKVQPAEDGSVSAVDVLAAMRVQLRLKQYSYRTEQTYVDWIERFFRYLVDASGEKSGRHVVTPPRIKDFLAWLVLRKNVSASTQNQAFNALLFMCRQVLHLELGEMAEGLRAKKGRKLPVVMTMEEVRLLLQKMDGRARLMARLIYSGGLRVMECCRLRVKDIDFDNNLIFVRSGKGDKDRSTLLAESLLPELREHMELVKALHAKDLEAGLAPVWLPNALERKYPNAGRELGWQWLFPSKTLSTDPRSGKVRRHHVSDVSIQRAVKDAVRKAGIIKPCSVHTLRHTFATHLLLHGVDIRQIQDYLGHSNVETTMVYTHVVKGLRSPAQSPLDMMKR